MGQQNMNTRSVLDKQIVLNRLIVSLLVGGLLASTAGFASAQTNTRVAKTQNGKANAVRFERASNGISAPLVDQGDYYFHPDGSKITFLRKKDVYAVRTKVSASRSKSVSSAVSAMQRIESQFGDRVEKISKHRLGNANIVRIKENRASKKATGATSTLSPRMLKSASSEIAELQPVLANSKGLGDILITPKMLVKLANQETAVADLAKLEKRYGLRTVRRLKVSGHVYSMALNARPADSSDIFPLVRNVALDSRVAFAQPQFKSKPHKTSFVTFEPNDPLFNQQWHLRNTGIGGSRCDTDCDANNAWGLDIDGVGGPDNGVGAVSGAGVVIAVIDDGVQLDHEDLNIWVNPNLPTNNSDGCLGDVNGCDFVDDDPMAVGFCENDGDDGPDGDPSPQPATNCVSGLDPFEEDNHGTAVAGVAAAKGNNTPVPLGVAGVAYSAEILPIRLISDYDTDINDDFCARAAEAMTYAGRYADVINNSWGMSSGTCPMLEDAIEDVLTGMIMDDHDDDINTAEINVSKRPTLGSSVLFASGNSASGWIKVTVPVSAGEHAYEWRFLRSDDPDAFDFFDESDSAWIDDIIWPDGGTDNFEAGGTLPSNFTSEIILNQECNAVCTSFLAPGIQPEWDIDTRRNRTPEADVMGASQAVGIATLGADCGNSYLYSLRDGPAGEISFWIWVDTDLQQFSDRVEFLVDGVEQLSFGDLPAVVNNEVGYPASLSATGMEPGLISVGSSNAGDLSGMTTAGLTFEDRSPYSQYGPSLDVLAPSDNQHLAIYTTDRYGVDGEGYNDSNDLGLVVNNSEYPYTDDFGGTSAATPLAAGVVAAMIAVNNSLTAQELRDKLRATADKIGGDQASYIADGGNRSEFYGYGRVNMFKALQSANGVAVPLEPAAGFCSSPEPFSYTVLTDLILPAYAPQPTEFCPAVGLVPEDELCVPIKTQNNKVAVICL